MVVLLAFYVFAWSVYFNAPPSAGIFENALLNLLKSANFSVDIAIYNLDDEKVVKMLRAKENEGVRVRIVMEGENYLSKIRFLQGLNVVADPMNNGLMHEKFAVVDDKTVWIGSANFTVSSFKRDLNNAIVLHSASLARIFEKEFDLMYNGYFSSSIPSKQIIVEKMKIFVGFSPSEEIFDEILDVLKSATDEVYIAMYAFSDWRLALTLVWLDERGVRIHVLADSKWNTSRFSVLNDMRQFNFTACENPYGLLHDKYMIIDPNRENAAVVIGSYNFTKSAQLKNNEVILVLRSRKIAKLYVENFKKILREFGKK